MIESIGRDCFSGRDPTVAGGARTHEIGPFRENQENGPFGENHENGPFRENQEDGPTPESRDDGSIQGSEEKGQQSTPGKRLVRDER